MRAWATLGLLAAVTSCVAEPASLRELAPGVYARQVPQEPVFRGPNHGFVVMADQVVVIDPGFPEQARALLGEVERITRKPVRTVLVTHAHGDHADGAFVFRDRGAEIVAARAAQRELEGPARRRFARAKQAGAPGYAAARFVSPTRYFDERLVLEDATQRIELLHLGHAHTPGDAVAWLPRSSVLFAGDVCDNGAYSTLDQGDSQGWIDVLARLIELRPRQVVPGHGALASGHVLALQRRYFVQLRAAVGRGLAARWSPAQIAASLDLPFYERWTGRSPTTRVRDVEHVYVEFGGTLPPQRPPRWPKRRAAVLAVAAAALLAVVMAFVRRRRARRHS